MQLKQNISILVHKLMHFISAIISGGLSAMLAQLLSFFNSVFKSSYPNLILDWHFSQLLTNKHLATQQNFIILFTF